MKHVFKFLFIAAFLFVVQTSYAQPPNDSCSGAIPIMPSPAGTVCAVDTFMLPFSTDSTTASGILSPYNSDLGSLPGPCVTAGRDQWFTWIATTGRLKFTPLMGSPGFHVFANSCNQLSSDPSFGYNSGWCTNFYPTSLWGWDIGDTLLLRVFDFNPTIAVDVSFCLQLDTVPANNTCSGAIPITVSPPGTGCATSTFNIDNGSDGTTPSFDTVWNCAPGSIAYDQWFSWVATSPALKFDGPFSGTAEVDVFSSCPNGTPAVEISCNNPLFSLLSGWSVGDTILLRFYNGLFYYPRGLSFCLEEANLPPVNDVCSGAIPIAPFPIGTACPDSAFTLPFSTDGTTSSGVPAPFITTGLPMSCPTAGRDQWFTWVATSSRLDFTSLAPSFPGIHVYNNNCSAFASGAGGITCQLGDMIGWDIGDTIYIRIHDSNPVVAQDVSFCLNVGATPPNDLCSGAIPITPSLEGTGCIVGAPTFYLPYTTDGTTPSLSSALGSCYTDSYDQWFSWVATSVGLTFFPSTQEKMQVFERCPDGLPGASISCGGSMGQVVHSGWAIGDTLLIQISEHAGLGRFDREFCLELNANPPFPVELASFTCEKQESINLLKWISATEENTEFHVIERSENTNTWTEIGRLDAAGNSSQDIHYELSDHEPLEDAYYRLKTVDLDGSVNYSRTIHVKRSANGFKNGRLYPNPTEDILNIEYYGKNQGNILIVITDLVGKVVAVHSTTVNVGENTFEISTTDLSSGVYFLTIRDGGVLMTKRFAKAN